MLATDLSQKQIQDLIGQLDSKRGATAQRRKDAGMRWDLFRGELASYVKQHIKKNYVGSAHQRALLKYADNQPVNLFRQVVEAVTRNTYARPPIRILDGESDELNKKMQAMIRESELDTKAPSYLQLAFAMGVAILLPRIIRSKRTDKLQMSLEIVLPHQCEILPDLDDPSKIAILAYRVSDSQVMVIDGEAYRIYDNQGKLFMEDFHGVGEFPGSDWSLEDPTIEGFWRGNKCRPLVDGAVEYGHVHAVASYCRKGQHKKVPIVKMENISDLPNNALFVNNEIPLVISKDPDEVSVEILDFNTPFTNFKEHLAHLFERSVEAFGISSGAVDFDPATGAVNVQEQHRLAEVRNAQIVHLMKAEADLIYKMAKAIWMHPERSDYDNAVDPAIVADAFKVKFPPSGFSDHPLKELEYWEKKIDLGFASRIDYLIEKDPYLSRDDAKEILVRSAIEQSEWKAVWEQHNSKKDAVGNTEQAEDRASSNPGETLPQTQGREGGIKSGEVRREQTEE